mmetsp:Transcript_5309/g.7398  ORF Transcript_5309/g.7398 Transcript_5309/m.7398 type:complete len:245 (-) Transcript_5309:184-918(-)
MNEEVIIGCAVRIEEVSEAIALLARVGIGIGLSVESIFCGTYYMCKFVSRVVCSQSDVRDVGLASLLVAVKMIEPDWTKSLWYILSRSLKYPAKEGVQRLRDLEDKIVSTLEWKLVFYSPIHYLNRLLYDLNLDVSTEVVRQFSSQLLLEALLSTGESSSTRSRKRRRSILDQRTVLRSTVQELAANLLQQWFLADSHIKRTPVPGLSSRDTADERLPSSATPDFEYSKRAHMCNPKSTSLRAA